MSEETTTPSATQQAILDEYRALLSNVKTLNASITKLATLPSGPILDDLRAVEKKTGLVFTLLKASVYALLMQQQEEDARNNDDSVLQEMGLNLSINDSPAGVRGNAQ